MQEMTAEQWVRLQYRHAHMDSFGIIWSAFGKKGEFIGLGWYDAAVRLGRTDAEPKKTAVDAGTMAVADMLLEACASPGGMLKPWKPFDVHQLATRIVAIVRATPASHPADWDAAIEAAARKCEASAALTFGMHAFIRLECATRIRALKRGPASEQEAR